MRLEILEGGHHRLRARMFMSLVRRRSGVELADVAKTMLYRPDFLGGPLLDLTAAAMRGPSFWTAGEREYLAMFTARLHQCRFCIDSHTELTRIASRGEIDVADPASARHELRAVLPFLEKVTRTPDLVAANDRARVRDAGVPDSAIVEALYVNFVWNTVNRLAHAFDYRLGGERELRAGTRSLHRFGYRFPAFLTR